MRLSFDVFGKAAPAGSKRAFRHPQTGAIIVTDANKGARGWKQEVAGAARAVYNGPLLHEPLCVRFVFVKARPKSHFNSKGLVKDALIRAQPTTRPDLLKQARGVEDALSGVIYKDDSQIVEEVLIKKYGELDVCHITIWTSQPR